MMRITSDQEEALARVVDDALREEIFEFAREDLAEAVAHLDDEILRARIARDFAASCRLGVCEAQALFELVTLSLMLGDPPFYERPGLRRLFLGPSPERIPRELLRMVAKDAEKWWPDAPGGNTGDRTP